MSVESGCFLLSQLNREVRRFVLVTGRLMESEAKLSIWRRFRCRWGKNTFLWTEPRIWRNPRPATVLPPVNQVDLLTRSMFFPVQAPMLASCRAIGSSSRSCGGDGGGVIRSSIVHGSLMGIGGSYRSTSTQQGGRGSRSIRTVQCFTWSIV